jgi:hypothetical protein
MVIDIRVSTITQLLIVHSKLHTELGRSGGGAWDLWAEFLADCEGFEKWVLRTICQSIFYPSCVTKTGKIYNKLAINSQCLILLVEYFHNLLDNPYLCGMRVLRARDFLSLSIVKK